MIRSIRSLWSGICQYGKTHLIGIIVSILLFFQIFFIPKWTQDAPEFQVANLLVILVIVIEYLVYKLILFFRKNPKFNLSESPAILKTLGSVIAILFGLLFGLLLMYIVNPAQAFAGFLIILKGGFNRGLASVGDMIFYSVPVILTGLSVAFAFRTGLFNIGATGQLTVGAYVAVYIGVKWGFLGEIHPLLHWGTAMLGAMLMGGFWGLIPGLLKAYRNVNEVVSSIMLNYIAMYSVTLWIKQNILNQTYFRALDIKPTAISPYLNLQYLFPGSIITGSIVIAIIVALVIHMLLNKTTFGYELKAVGFNQNASRYAGINSKRNMALSMAISGAIAGIAGAIIFLKMGKHMKPENVLMAEGFTGIAISLLGFSNPFGVIAAGLFYGSLQQGGYYLQLLRFQPEIIDIIIAVIIYTSALGLALQKYAAKILKWLPLKRPKKRVAKEEAKQ